MAKDRDSNTARSMGGTALGGAAGAALGHKGGLKALAMRDKQIARRMAKDPAFAKAMRGAKGSGHKAGLSLAKAMRTLGVGMGGAGAVLSAPVWATGGLAPFIVPREVALVMAAGIPLGLAGVGVHSGGEKLQKKLLAKQIARRARFARGGLGAGLAGGALLGGLALGGKRLEKKSSAELGNPFLAGFVDELVHISVL